MARLHEYQGKKILRQSGFQLPDGLVAHTAEEARKAAEDLGGSVVIKAQVWTTGRAKMGGIEFADSPEEAEAVAKHIFQLKVGDFPVESVLVERKIDIEQEFYIGLIIDDANARPVMIFSSRGGSGIEEIADEYPDSVIRYSIDIVKGIPSYIARDLVRKTGINGKLQMQLGQAMSQLWDVARKYEARAMEINPLVLTKEGKLFAADCRVTVDDYAVFRHPDLGIEVAREFGHPPTPLEKVAYEVEKKDHRGTFYFIRMASGFGPGEGYIGFHGAGGGGSMMSMDAITNTGFNLANFTDTSGNPSANKVYRAAIIILSQPNLDGYFGSGSGVASQEQFHSAYGLAKAFVEVGLDIPAVIRLGGNREDRAVKILEEACKDLPGKVEGYKKDDTPDFCANRFKELVEKSRERDKPRKNIFRRPAYTPPENVLEIGIADGTVYIDLDQCDEKTNAVILEICTHVIEIRDGKPALAVSEEEAASGRFTGWIACEMECRIRANPAVSVDLPISGLDEALKKMD